VFSSFETAQVSDSNFTAFQSSPLAIVTNALVVEDRFPRGLHVVALNQPNLNPQTSCEQATTSWLRNFEE
jgi:hypothetical protein